MDRRQNKNASSALNPKPEVNELQEMITEDPPTVTHLRVDQECQVNFDSESDVNFHTFVCNRYVKNEICHAETQTEIIDDTRSIKVKIDKKNCISKNVVLLIQHLLIKKCNLTLLSSLAFHR